MKCWRKHVSKILSGQRGMSFFFVFFVSRDGNWLSLARMKVSTGFVRHLSNSSISDEAQQQELRGTAGTVTGVGAGAGPGPGRGPTPSTLPARALFIALRIRIDDKSVRAANFDSSDCTTLTGVAHRHAQTCSHLHFEGDGEGKGEGKDYQLVVTVCFAHWLRRQLHHSMRQGQLQIMID